MRRRLLTSIGMIGTLLSAIVATVLPAKAFTVPAYENLVADYANVLSPQFETELNTELQQFAEQNNGYEVAVVTVESLNNEAAAQVAQQFYDEWKIGKSEADNGALLLVALNDHQVHVYTGVATRDLITDTEKDTIIRQQIDPAFQQNAYERGVRAAITQIRQQLTDETFGNINPLNQSPEVLQQFASTIGLSLLAIIAITALTFLAARYGTKKVSWLGGLVGAVLGTLVAGAAMGIFFGSVGLGFDYHWSMKTKKSKRNA